MSLRGWNEYAVTFYDTQFTKLSLIGKILSLKAVSVFELVPDAS